MDGVKRFMTTRGAGATDVGRKRDTNQDSIVVDDGLGLYAVADGMGGHAAGEVASSLALSSLADALRADRPAIDLALSGDELAAELRAVLGKAMLSACAAVHASASSGDPATQGMGTTLTALLCLGEHAVVGHVGDSRAYMLREGTVHQLTTDHTFAAELVKVGVLNSSDVKKHPHAHVLTRALGPQPAVAVELLVVPLRDGDRFLLSSDGLSEYIPDFAWLSDALETESSDELLKELITFANEAGGQDNVSVVCADVEETGSNSQSSEIDSLFAAVHAVPLFDGLGLASATRVLNHCQVQDFRSGDIVFDVEETRRALIVVLSGSFSLESADDLRKARLLSVGDYIGATTLVYPRAARRALKCTEAGQALFLWSDRLSELAKRRPALGARLYARLAARLAKQLDAALTDSTEGRDQRESSPEWF